MTHTVFIDGQAGTTGLELATRLCRHPQIRLLAIEDRFRKDAVRRRELFACADVVALCLPDDAARAAVALAPDARFLDASTAHRVCDGWTYGLPELTAEQRAAIRDAPRVANPGCYPTGFLLCVRPLIDAGVLSADVPLRVHAVSGYSGGGKAMIENYETSDAQTSGVRPYGLGLSHKHVPEMGAYSGTTQAPLFAPAVGHYYKGMLVQVPLFTSELSGGAGLADVHAVLAARYAKEPFVTVWPRGADELLEGGFLNPMARNDTNELDIAVFGHDEQLLIVSRFDNLGKGAAGAAVQNLNLMLGMAETTGLQAPRTRCLDGNT